MKNVKVIGWASMLFLLLMVSCRKDNIDPKIDTSTPDPIVLVESSLRGQVVDEDNNPVEGAFIEIGDLTTSSDENGVFKFEKQDFNANGTLVTVKKDGYFLGAKLFNPQLGEESYVLFQLLNQSFDSNFPSSVGAKIETADNASVTFGANSIMYENGTDYSGEVQVAIKWLDPSSLTVVDQMPGDLRAINLSDDAVQLATYGMLAVELQAPNGTALQVKTGTKATISLPVPASMIAQAPTTIPLWSFNEDNGHWVEESTATLEGNNYVGDVSHFSFWNCDAPFPLVNLEGTVVDPAGNPIANVKVIITYNGTNAGYGWTNSAGVYAGKVPKDELLTLEVYNLCNQVVYSDEIGPLSTDVVIPPVEVTEATITTLTGSLEKCDGSAVTNGYAYISGFGYWNGIADLDASGVFSRTYLICEGVDFTVQGYDLDVPLTSEPLTVTAPAGSGTIDVGVLEVCETITNLIHVSIPSLSYDTDFFVYQINDYSGTEEGVQIYAYADSVELQLIFQIDPLQTGTVMTSYFSFGDFGVNSPIPDYYFGCANSNGICPDAEILTNEGSGGTFEGVLDGDFINIYDQGSTATYQIIVDFNVLFD